MSTKNRSQSFMRKDQRGMASILITMITMIVVSLIVLGFAMISRREQGNTLDQQLSTQAFYAAESGVNDASKVVKSAIAAGGATAVPSKTSCSDPGSDPTHYPYPSSAAETQIGPNVSYTCLLVNPTASTLIYDGVDSRPRVVPINTTSGSTIDNITITWTSESIATPTVGCPPVATDSFSATTNWTCGYGVLRVDLVPTQAPFARSDLQSSELTTFLVPVKGGAGSVSYGAHGSANVSAANCNATNCSVNISGLPDLSSLALRISSAYQAAGTVTIESFSGTTPVKVFGQVTVDATGRANGVLRRIQVRIPVTGSSGLEQGPALQSNAGICKRFYAAKGYLSFPGDIKSPDSTNAMCTISGVR